MIPAWPPAGAVESRWATKGNFWELSRSVGRENPWDLIIFNFQTQDPLEVNWYLHHAVGCWNLTSSGNFKFEKSVTKDGKGGIIYIPPPHWRPPSYFSKGSGAGTFVSGIQHSAVAMLRGLSGRMPTVSHGETTMLPRDYATVADLIERQEVALDVNPDLGGRGGYHDWEKRIVLRYIPRIGNARHVGTLANEAVHVATHYYEIANNRLKNEYVSTVVGSIAIGVSSERILERLIDPDRYKYWRYYYAGWVWLNYLKPSGVWRLDLDYLDQEFEHPFLSKPVNAFSALKESMDKSYGWAAKVEDIPEWD